MIRVSRLTRLEHSMTLRRSRFHALSAAFAALALAACQRDAPSSSEQDIQRELDRTSAVDVLEDTAEASYQPPADAKLTDAQMKMFLAVKGRERQILEVAAKNLKEKTADAEKQGEQVGFFDAMKALGDLGDIMTADLRAAKELGYNTAEYEWVKGQVLEAQMQKMAQGMADMMSTFQQQSLQMLEQQKAAATDAAQRAEIERQIEELESAAPEQEKPSAAVQHNAALLERYRAEVDAIQAEVARWQAVAGGGGSTGSDSGSGR
jgi:hypothetical protein